MVSIVGLLAILCYILVKALPQVAQDEAECYISLETKLECYFFHIALAAVLQLVYVLAGLFEQIAKVLLSWGH